MRMDVIRSYGAGLTVLVLARIILTED